MRVETFTTLSERMNTLQVHLIDSGWLEADARWHYEKVCSPFNRLYFIHAGAAAVRNPMAHMDLRPGCIYLIPAGLVNDYHCPTMMQKTFFHFNLLLPNGLDLFDGLQSCFELTDMVREVELARTLIRSRSLADVFQMKQLLDEVLARLIRLSDVENQTVRAWSELLDRFFALISRKATAETRVSDLARQLAVTPSALSRRFKQETGMTISHYLDGLLLRRACRLLLSTRQSVAGIAEELQFCDPYYFSRYFKKRMGETPTAYRRRLAGLT